MQILTLDSTALQSATTELANQMRHKDLQPDVIVGIKSGGWHVAKEMQKQFPTCPIAGIRSSRPSTKLKRRFKFKNILRILPYAITNQLRLLEHKKIEKNYFSGVGKKNRGISEDDATALIRRLPAGKEIKILIVDDAVDSGETLRSVSNYINEKTSNQAKIFTAAITTTFIDPIQKPDFSLYYRTLCRFPWSDDY